ncbi:MAG: AAA family ATPase [Candidatus Omnitrophica bacterium]|nr:AAA family ATPase [Candidatus Omnitrophota bacterium]
MYEEYWGLREKPFENTPNPRFFYHSREHEEAFARLIYAIRERKGAAMISGEYGCGKTLLGRALMAELTDSRYDVAVLSNPKLSSSQFLKEVVHQLGGNGASNDKVTLMHTLNEILYGNFRRDKETVILIDEAQAIPDEEVFEEIRLLLNFQLNDRFLLTLLLLGQPELREKVEKIPQLSQRIAIRYHLKGLTYQETQTYVKHRLKIAGAYYDMFDDPSYPLIFEFTGGVPRKINNLCDLCLFEGLGERATRIGNAIIKNVIEDLHGKYLDENIQQNVG